MGDTRIRQGVLEHETSRDRWERIVLDDCGQPLSVCLHGEEPAAVMDEGSGQIIMELGGIAVSMAPEMAAKWVDELVKVIGPATDTKLRAEYRAKAEVYRQAAVDERMAIETETATMRDELTAIGEAIDAARVELTSVEATRTEATSGAAEPAG